MNRSLRIISTLLLLLTIMVMTGCAASPRTHFTNLKNDFLDISRASVAGGPIGFGVNVKATEFLELKYDDYETYRLGWLGRGVGLWHETSLGGKIFNHSFPLPYENNYECSISFKAGNANELMGSMINTTRGRGGSISNNFFTTPDEFRLAAYLGYIGFDVGLRPLEALDFICGLLSLGWLDILEDDQLKKISIQLNVEEAILEVLAEFIEDKDAIKNEDAFKEAVENAVTNEEAYKEAFKEVLKDQQVWENKEMLKKKFRQALIEKGAFKSKDDKSSDETSVPPPIP